MYNIKQFESTEGYEMMRKRKRIIPLIIYLILLLLFGVFFSYQNVWAEPEQDSEPLSRRKMVIIGDSYGLGYTVDDSVDVETETWPAQVISRIGTEDSIVVAKIGAGFVKANEGESFLTLLEKAWELSDDPDSVEELIVCGGFNDKYYSDSTIFYAAQFFTNTAERLFPNARIHLGMVSWEENNSVVQSQILNNVLPAYRKTAELNGLHYISGCEYIYPNSFGAFSADHFHPNAYGQTLLADYISKYLQDENYFTGLKQEDGNWYWFENGVIDTDFTGLKMNEYGWWYVEDGKVDFSYNGFAKNDHGWWYVENGTITFRKNDIINGIANIETEEAEEAWWYIHNSKVMNAKTIAQNKYGWWYVENGKVDFSYNGVQQNEYGWWYVEDGKVDFAYNGFAANSYGWWYAENGKVTFEKNDILRGSANVEPEKDGEDAWWFIAGSRVTRAETVAQNAYGWWYVNEGKVDFTYTGIQANEYGKWAIEDGQVDFHYNGFIYSDQNWWLVKDGKVNDAKEDIVYGEANSIPDADPEAAWWYIREGKVTNTETVAENIYGYWYVKDGKVDFSHTGYEFINNCIWHIKEGKAELVFQY